ncbi:transposase [Streptomyces azureus]|uniref:transposase n=1 Tax=Streptomyces azureus TaxID=146537 RepID=UPI003C2D7321
MTGRDAVRLLNQADWDADAVRDEVRGFVLEHLGAEDSVLIVDETGFINGVRSARVQRQYTGTSGKIDNGQLGASPTLPTGGGRCSTGGCTCRPAGLKHFRRRRTKPAWTTTRSVNIRPGTGTSPWPWRPPPI